MVFFLDVDEHPSLICIEELETLVFLVQLRVDVVKEVQDLLALKVPPKIVCELIVFSVPGQLLRLSQKMVQSALILADFKDLLFKKCVHSCILFAELLHLHLGETHLKTLCF